MLFATWLSFWMGRGYQHVTAGFYCTPTSEKTQKTRFGKITLRHDSEKFGWWSSAKDYSVISFYVEGVGEIIVYRAQSNGLGKEKGYGNVESVAVDENVLRWEDGWCKYELRITPVATKEHPSTP